MNNSPNFTMKSQWSKESYEIAIDQLNIISGQLNLPKRVKNSALKLYSKYTEKKRLSGRTIGSMISACLYYSCKKSNLPISINDLIEGNYLKSNKKKEIFSSYKALMKELHLDFPHSSPHIFLKKIITHFKISKDVGKKINDIMKILENNNLVSGKDPRIIAATALFIAIGKDFIYTQIDVANFLNITSVGLNKNIKKTQRFLEELKRK